MAERGKAAQQRKEVQQMMGPFANVCADTNQHKSTWTHFKWEITGGLMHSWLVLHLKPQIFQHNLSASFQPLQNMQTSALADKNNFVSSPY